MICLFLFFVLLALLVLYVLQEEHICQEIQNIPGPPLVPFFRNETEIDLYMKDALNNVDKLIREYGSIVRLCIGSKVIVLLTEPKYIEQLLRSEGINCTEDFNGSVEKIYNWVENKLGPFFRKFVNAQILCLSDSVHVDSEFLSYFTQKGADATKNKSEFSLCLFKAERILKSPVAKLTERSLELTTEDAHSSNSIVRFLVISALIIFAKHPGVQREALDEIRRIFGEDEINFQSVRSLKCLGGVLKRIIRSHTSARLILTKKIRFDNISIPAGVNVVIFTSSDDSSANPPKQPDFNGNIKENSDLNTPLITNPKRCLGQKYVTLRAKLVLTKLIRSFEVIPTQKENNGPSFNLKHRQRS